MKKVLFLFSLFMFLSNSLLADEGVLKIGSISILTGEGSSFGVAAKNGLSMAVEELNSKGGVLGKNVVVDYQDDQGDPKNTISAFRQLTEMSNVSFIIGPSFSRCAIPLIKLADDKKVIMISPSAGMADFNEASKYLFNTWPHDYITSEKLANYVFSKGHRKVALVGAEDPWVKEQTRYFKMHFEELGGQISFISEPLPGTSDLKTIALKISKTPGVDAFVSTTDGVIVGSLAAKALKQISFDVPKYSVTIDQAAIDAAHGGFEGMEFPSSLTPTADFKLRYESKFKVNIEIGADSAYDAMMMLAKSITEANSTDADLVAEELAKITNYPGASGLLMSDGKGGFTKGFSMKKIKDGKQIDLD